MNTTDHFAAAERLLHRSDEMEPEYARLTVAQAQVHAALAGIDEQRAVTKMMQTAAADALSAIEFEEALSPVPKPDTSPEPSGNPEQFTHSGVVIPWPPTSGLTATIAKVLRDNSTRSSIRQAQLVLDAIAEYAGGAS